jgi:hypothetical protein
VTTAVNTTDAFSAGALRADPYRSFEFSILRNFPIKETLRVQHRGGLFNACNHPNFGGPGRVSGGPGFGVVSSAGMARAVQVGLRILY